jgi:acyl-CoA thioesterase I
MFKQFLRALGALGFLAMAVAPAFAESFKIVGFGDSLMAGYQLDNGQSFPERLEVALRERGHDVVITNAGVSGDTTSGGLARLDWSVPDDTDLVILQLGANDMLRGLDPQITERNLDEMIARLRDRDIDIVLAGMFAAPNLGSDYGARFNGLYPRLAEKYDLPLYPFFLDGVLTQASLLLADGMHPNARGVDRMVENFLPTIEPLIMRARSGG